MQPVWYFTLKLNSFFLVAFRSRGVKIETIPCRVIAVCHDKNEFSPCSEMTTLLNFGEILQPSTEDMVLWFRLYADQKLLSKI